MTTTDLAAPVKQVSLSYAEALLRDVPRYSLNMLAIEMTETPHGGWVKLPAVEAALTADLEGMDDRAWEFCDEMLKDNQPLPSLNRIGKDRREAGRLIYNLLTQNAFLLAEINALRAERDRYLRHLTAGAESLNAYKARAEAAEAERDKQAKAHEKEIYVWSENYAALERKLTAAPAPTDAAQVREAALREAADKIYAKLISKMRYREAQSARDTILALTGDART